MSINATELSAKIKSFYPEIDKYGLTLTLQDVPEKKAWLVRLGKGGTHELTTFLEPSDTEACLLGKECVHLSHQIGQFLSNYCGGDCAAA